MCIDIKRNRSKLLIFVCLIMFLFTVACSTKNENTNKSKYVQETKLYDFYNEYKIDISGFFGDFYFDEGVLWDIVGDFVNSGEFYQVYPNDSIVFWLENKIDDTINKLKNQENLSIDVINLGNIDKISPSRDVVNIGISVDTDQGKYYYALYYDYLGLFYNNNDTLSGFLDSIMLDNYILSTTSAYVNPSDDQKINFLFPIQYASEHSVIENDGNDNQMSYKLKRSFDDLASFYIDSVRGGNEIDYENKTITLYDIKTETDENNFDGVKLVYTSDISQSGYGDVLVSALRK